MSGFDQDILFEIVNVQWGGYLLASGNLFARVDRDHPIPDAIAPLNDSVQNVVRTHVDGTPPLPDPHLSNTVLFVKSFSVAPVVAGVTFLSGGQTKSIAGATVFNDPNTQQDFTFGDWAWDGFPFVETDFSLGVLPSPIQFARVTGGNVSGEDFLGGAGHPVLDTNGRTFTVTDTIDFVTKAYALTEPYDDGGNAGWFSNGDVDLLHYLSSAPAASADAAFMAQMWIDGDTMQSFSVSFTGMYATYQGTRYDIAGISISGDAPSVGFHVLMKPTGPA